MNINKKNKIQNHFGSNQLMKKTLGLIFFTTLPLYLIGCADEIPLSQRSDRYLCTELHTKDGAAEELNRRINNGTLTVTHDECIMIGVYAAGNPTPSEEPNCDCPDDLDSSGNKCGERSAWIRPGGRVPICYGVVGQ